MPVHYKILEYNPMNPSVPQGIIRSVEELQTALDDLGHANFRVVATLASSADHHTLILSAEGP